MEKSKLISAFVGTAALFVCFFFKKFPKGLQIGLVFASGTVMVLYGVYGLWRGEVRDRYWKLMRRHENPFWYWFQIAVYIGFGSVFVAICLFLHEKL